MSATPATSYTAVSLDAIREPVRADLLAMDELIATQLHSDVEVINEIGHYLVSSGGKRLRPLVALLAAKACGYEGDKHVELAAIIEFIHTATLLHDDVVDASDLRRGKSTANHVYGNEASVLVGDFLYSRAFQMLVHVRDMAIMEVFADTTNAIAEGEVLQLVNCGDPDTSEERYFEIIRRKTAMLFQAAGRAGAMLARSEFSLQECLAAYGRHLGIAFQLVDDALDYDADPELLGKNLGDDLAQGKPTLPLLYAIWNAPKQQSSSIRDALLADNTPDLDVITQAIESSGAITYTRARAAAEVDLAREALRPLRTSRFKQALIDAARFAVQRAN